MRRLSQALAAALSLAALLSTGCHDNANSTSDGGATDGLAHRCTAYDYVIDEIEVPSSPAEARRGGYDFDNDGTPDNALGSMLAAMSAAGWPGFQPMVETGKLLVLVRIVFHYRIKRDDPTAFWASAFLWNAAAQDCAVAGTDCFGGDHALTRAPYSRNEALAGSMKDSVGVFGGGPVTMRLYFSSLSHTTITFPVWELSLRTTPTGLKQSLLATILRKKDVSSELVPALASALDEALHDPRSPPQRKRGSPKVRVGAAAG